MLEDGVADSQTTFSLLPFTSMTRVLTEYLPEVRSNGFLHVSSDQGIVVSGIEGKSDLTALGNLAASHSQPDYTPPNPTRFNITGTIRHNGVPFGGVNVQLSGTVKRVGDNRFGGYLFLLEHSAGLIHHSACERAGYAFNPTTMSVNITDQTSRNNDFGSDAADSGHPGARSNGHHCGKSEHADIGRRRPLQCKQHNYFRR